MTPPISIQAAVRPPARPRAWWRAGARPRDSVRVAPNVTSRVAICNLRLPPPSRPPGAAPTHAARCCRLGRAPDPAPPTLLAAAVGAALPVPLPASLSDRIELSLHPRASAGSVSHWGGGGRPPPPLPSRPPWPSRRPPFRPFPSGAGLCFAPPLLPSPALADGVDSHVGDAALPPSPHRRRAASGGRGWQRRPRGARRRGAVEGGGLPVGRRR